MMFLAAGVFFRRPAVTHRMFNIILYLYIYLYRHNYRPEQFSSRGPFLHRPVVTQRMIKTPFYLSMFISLDISIAPHNFF